jgi:hypothetical protein
MGLLTNLIKDVAGAQQQAIAAQKEAIAAQREVFKESFSAQKEVLSELFGGKKNKAKKQAEKPAVMCDQCGGKFTPDGQFCPHCGAPAPEPEDEYADAEAAFSFCGQCGGKIASGSQFCPECGAPAPEPADDDEDVEEEEVDEDDDEDEEEDVDEDEEEEDDDEEEDEVDEDEDAVDEDDVSDETPAPVKAASPAFVPNGAYVLPVAAGVLRLTQQNTRLPDGFSGVLVIPEGVKVIESNCFRDQKDITELWLPKSLKKIKGDAFCDDNGDSPESLLEKIVIGANVTIEEPYWDEKFHDEYADYNNCAAGTYLLTNDGGDYSWDIEK